MHHCVTKLTYLRLTLSWHRQRSDEDLELDERIPLYHFNSPPVQQNTETPHPMTLALQALNPIICAQRIMECVSTVKTIALEWDHGPHPGQFVAVVEEEEGVQSLTPLTCWRFGSLCTKVRAVGSRIYHQMKMVIVPSIGDVLQEGGPRCAVYISTLYYSELSK